MLLSSFFTHSMAFTHTPRVQLPFALFSETFLTIRQNSLYVTVCIIARPSYRGYFIHSLSTLHYCNAPSLATRLTGDYRDWTCTGKCCPASLDTRHKKTATHYKCMTAMYYYSILFLLFICHYAFEWVSFHACLTSDNLALSLTSNTTFANSFLENVVSSFFAIIIIKSITLYMSKL